MKLFGKKDTAVSAPKENQPVKKNWDESVVKSVFVWMYRLRSVFLAIPVVFAAVVLAIANATRLPDQVMLCVPSFGEDQMVVELMEISKSLAVFGPLLITFGCLIAVFCSRRVAYPWLISAFSLVLPVFIYFASVFPG